VNKLELYSRVVMLGWLAGWGKVSMVVRGARIDKPRSNCQVPEQECDSVAARALLL